ncbi:MAG: leucine--tRNA ligase [Planctomycetota bacterium]
MTEPTRNASSDTPPHRFGPGVVNGENIELKWQGAWADADLYRTPNPGEPGFDAGKPKFYVLDMFPYPSGAGLHVGHPEGYTATDILGRYKAMTGHRVLHPMGWDAFGLPAEQHAINTGEHPAGFTRQTIETFKRQLQRFGFAYDWSREVATIDEDYYRWTQWIFLQIYNAWFDDDADGGRGKARAITELVAELESGSRPAVFNPKASEYSSAASRGGELLPWAEMDAETKRAIVDSYRLTYISEQTVNWCPKLGTALANEEVIDGRSERGGHPVFRKPLRQWQFRITAYADRLLRGLDDLDWPTSTKTQQAEWIGRSEGAFIDFEVVSDDGPRPPALRVFTTRPDTVFGATYMVVAPEHPLVNQVLDEPRAETDVDAVRAYVDWARNRTDVERQESKEKTGVFTGVYATNPLTGKLIPVWTADYVLIGYGTGAIMAVPAQDERDWEFAEKFGLPIVRTVQPPEGWEGDAYTGDGVAINSANDKVSLDGLGVNEAKAKIIAYLDDMGLGERTVNFKLRDWLFSRQRYWGEPFPIVYDERGAHHGVGEDTLPVVLPPLTDYEPVESDEPTPLLGKATDWVKTTAGDAGVADLPADAPVRRETNTMPGWAGSCWYYLRYADPKNADALIGGDADDAWLGEGGVDLYVGGAEHAVLHLLYARFWHQVLFDLGHVKSEEPFRRLFHQGLILSHAYQRKDKSLVAVDKVWRATYTDGGFAELRTPDSEIVVRSVDAPSLPSRVYESLQRDGELYLTLGDAVDVEDYHIHDAEVVTQTVAKMSKSLKNVVNPDDIIEDFGADTFRLYEMYMGPLDASKPWNTRDISGLMRFLQRFWRLCVDEQTGSVRTIESADAEIEKRLHRAIDKVGSDIDRLAFNTAIAAMIEFVNAALPSDGSASLTADQIDRAARMIAPFAPHLAEELWHRLGRFANVGSIHTQPWPEVDPAMLKDDEVEIPVQILGKLRAKIMMPADADQKAMEALALADERIAELIAGKTVRKVVVVPGRLVNIVAN